MPQHAHKPTPPRGCLLLAIAATMSAVAADNRWQGVADPAWENPANWSEGVLPGSVSNQTDTAIFDDPAGLLNPVLSTTQPPEDGSGRLQQIHFRNSGWTLAGNGLLRLQTGIRSEEAGTNRIETAVGLLGDSRIDVGGGNLLVLAGDIAGVGGRKVFRFHGTGTARLEGNVANVKDFGVFGGGTVELAMPARMNTDFEDRIEGGSTLRLLADEQCRIHWPRYTQNGVLDLNGRTQTFQGITFGHHNVDARFTVTTGEDGLLRLTGGLSFQPFNWDDRNRTGTPLIRGNVELAGSGWKNMTVVKQENTAVQIRIEAVISGAGGIRCQGDGTLQLTGANTYAGDTTVARAKLGSRTGAGRLIIDGSATENSSGTGMGSAAVTVEPTGLIGGSGAIGHIGRTGPALSLTGEFVPADPESETEETILYATVAPGGVTEGTEIGTLSVNGDVSLGAWSRLAADLGETGAGDTLAITGALAIDNTGTLLDLTLTPEASLAGDYTLVACAGRDGEFAAVRFNGGTVADPCRGRSVNGTHHLVYTATSVILRQSPPRGTTILLR